MPDPKLKGMFIRSDYREDLARFESLDPMMYDLFNYPAQVVDISVEHHEPTPRVGWPDIPRFELTMQYLVDGFGTDVGMPHVATFTDAVAAGILTDIIGVTFYGNVIFEGRSS